ncbi:hypothetical protein C0Q70_12647 [Pomacea canaliculata]|uniref:Zinc finger protein ZPR1 n=1 Tax=Pomacea canaliculata TaxID=400727 RepID=A0A2T7P239_POMCA|nr:hypothetical protein C0Q70_12647 [Pomacea canaliculata]
MASDGVEASKKPLFRDITADEDEPEITEIESLCVNCEEQGMTRLFLTKIPFFREVIVSSFTCDHCGFRNAELQSGGRIQDKGVQYSAIIKTPQDLNRQVVQTEFATIRIPCLDFEAPSKKGSLTTVEGIISRAVEDLEQGQQLRQIESPEMASKIAEFLIKMRGLLALSEPFELVSADTSTVLFNCGTHAPKRDPDMKITHYTRTRQQDVDLCIVSEESDIKEDEVIGVKDGDFNTQNEVLHFNVNCPSCNAPCPTNMKLVNIPYFKEVVIMATCCDACGHRDNEVKSGGGIEPKGRRITLVIEKSEDMTRDVLKSETCAIQIPELDFEMDFGTLGGKFTTVEGLLQDFKAQLGGENPFVGGDSSQSSTVEKLHHFCEQLDQIISGKWKGVHFILDDPAGNSYVQSFAAPDLDPQLTVEDYERSFEQNEFLGLNDMKTENYEQS